MAFTFSLPEALRSGVALAEVDEVIASLALDSQSIDIERHDALFDEEAVDVSPFSEEASGKLRNLLNGFSLVKSIDGCFFFMCRNKFVVEPFG